ncbi:MAG TPA: saccharopine dehydrogenase NADP-binding domain-containing protein [Pseudonocardia sp.]|nr:saccharopine dehydrogenase NADP-binding domain-containing protein [Pseudonocardia sp.]
MRDSVLVLGGSGAVGRAVTALLADGGISVRAASRTPPAVLPAGGRFHRLDARDPAAVARAVDGVRVVVDASGLDDPALAATAVAAGAHLLDLSADAAHLAALRRHADAARAREVTVLVGAGLAPGLTNLLAVDVHGRDPVGGIELDVVLGLGEQHGPAATAWMLAQLAAPPRHPPRRADLPADFGRRTLRWADFPEQHVLTEHLGTSVITRYALDPPLLAAVTVAAARLPTLRRALAAAAGLGPRLTGRDRWLVAARLPDGTGSWATGRGQSAGTAVVAARAVHELLAGRVPPGAYDLHQVSDLAAFSPWLHEHGITTGATQA